MGVIDGLLNLLFGGGRNVIRETAEVFRGNAEATSQREQAVRTQTMQQFGQEFAGTGQGGFDRFMDGVNRVPRPALALGTLGLFVAAMVDPIWFSQRMQGLALVPEPLWWLLGVVVSFYFGARHQVKSQQFQKSIAQTMARAPQVIENIGVLQALRATTPGAADPGPDVNLVSAAVLPDANAALEAWRKRKGRPATK